MDLAFVTLQQVGILFILIIIGFICGKTGVVTAEGKKVLSNLLVTIIMPAMILNSYLSEFDPNVLNNLLLAFGLSRGSRGRRGGPSPPDCPPGCAPRSGGSSRRPGGSPSLRRSPSRRSGPAARCQRERRLPSPHSR